MPFIKTDTVSLYGGCSNYGKCPIVMYDHDESYNPLQIFSVDTSVEGFNPADTWNKAHRIMAMGREKITATTLDDAINITKKQVFRKKNLYCLFDGVIDLTFHDGTFQKISAEYTSAWSSYADIWTYDKYCRIEPYKATVFGVLNLGFSDITNFTTKVRILENGSINEHVEPGSILAVIIDFAVVSEDGSQLNHSYTFNGESKDVSRIYYMNQYSNLIDLKTTDKCYLILLTPKS